MKIFILPTSYPDAEYPQKDIFIFEQAKELARRSHEIIVLHIKKLPSKSILSPQKRIIEEVDDGFAKRYVIYQKTFLEGKLLKLNKKAFLDSAEKLYAHAVSIHGKPDVIYAHFSCWAGYAAAKISRTYNIPLVVLEHYGKLLGDTLPKIMIQGIDYVREQAAYFCCVSPNLKHSIEKKGNVSKDIFVIPNMVDRQFKYVPPAQHDTFLFSSIGNLNAGKDFPLLIEAFCRAFSITDNVRLRIGGGGPEAKKLQELINCKGRAAQITLLGRLNREQTIQEYANCNVFALASQFETFGMVYREALVTGRPIITTDHGGFSADNWHDEYGLMVPVKDVVAFSEALRTIYRDYSSYDYEKISKLCLDDCSADTVGTYIENILCEAKSDGCTKL